MTIAIPPERLETRISGPVPVSQYHGTIIEPPASWTDDKISPGGVIDMHAIDPTWPYRFAMLASRDHQGDAGSGAYLFVSDSPASGWKNYDDSGVRDAFVAAGFSAAPASNPIFVNSASDYGEFPYIWYDPTKETFYATLHSSSLEIGQTQQLWSSSDGLSFTLVGPAHDRPGYPGSAHDGYGSYMWGPCGTLGVALMHDRDPLTYQHIRSIGGAEHFINDPRKIFGRDAAHWGTLDLEIGRNGHYFHVGDQLWQVGFIRNIPAAHAGTSMQGTLCAWPMSRDGRRMIGPPIVMTAKGGAGTDHEQATADGPVFVLQYAEKLWVYHQIHDASDVRRIGCTSIATSHSRRVMRSGYRPTEALSIQTGYEAAFAIDYDGHPLPAGAGSLRTLIDLDFSAISSTPSGVSEVAVSGTPTFSYSPADTGRGKLNILCDAVNEEANYQVDQGIATANFDEIRVNVYGLTLSSTGYLMQLGLRNASGYRLQLFTRHDEAYARLMFKDASTTQTSVDTYGLYPSVDDRYTHPTDYSIRFIRRHLPDKTEQLFLEWWNGDQILAKANIDSSFADFVGLPTLTIKRQSATVTAAVARFQVQVRESLRGN